MADEQLIKPRELPAVSVVYANDAIMVDDGVVVGKATPVQIVDAGAPVASEAEAIAGTDNSKRITPLNLKQVLDDTTAPAVTRAQAWAESPDTPDPAIPGSKSSKTWALESEASALRSADSANLSAALTAESPQSWADFARFLGYADGKVVWYNGVMFVRDRSANIAGLGPGASWKPAGPPSPWHFNAVCDGVTDDTDAYRAMFEYCNSASVSPDFSGVEFVTIQADAQISVNVSVNFRGAKFVILGGMVLNPDRTIPRLTAFRIEDPETPIVPSSGNVIGSDFAAGSYTSARGLIPSAGWLRYYVGSGTNLPRISSRDALTDMSWRAVQRVDHDIRTQYPLPVDMSGATSVASAYRLNPASTLVVSGANIDVSAFNNQTIFSVNRNMVDIADITFTQSGEPISVTVNSLIAVNECSDFRLIRVDGSACKNANNDGSYIFSPAWVAGFRVIDCKFIGHVGVDSNWGAVGAHNSNGMHYINCAIDRVDIHAYSGNLFVIGCELSSSGVVYGQGFGELQVIDCTYYNILNTQRMVSRRTDYGGGWDGDVTIRGANVIGAPSGITIADFSRMGNAVINQPLPRTITIAGIKYTRYSATPATGTGQMVTPLVIDVNASAFSVTAPSVIVIDGLECSERFRVAMSLDLASCALPPIGAAEGCTLSIRNMTSTNHSDAAGATLLIPSAKTGPASAQYALKVDIRNMGLTRIDVLGNSYAGSRLTASNCSITRIDAGNNWSISLIDNDFVTPSLRSPETAAPICPALSGSRYTTITGGRISGAFNISNAFAISGLASQASISANAVLPSGVTRAQLFTGWISA